MTSSGTPLLSVQDSVVAVLGSGSRGNCTYIGDGTSGVLVDCGLSTLQIFRRMDELGLTGAPIDAVLITHEHSDHVAAARILSNKLQKRLGRDVPFFMTHGTRQGLNPKVVPRDVQSVVPGVPWSVEHLRIEPFTVPHDTLDPVGYAVDLGGFRVGVVTDLGKVTRLVTRKLASLDLAVLEFNHDLEMLLEGAYPWRLKQRIRGPHGHLSNDQAGELLEQGLSAGRLKQVILAHLSEENNEPDRALEAASRAVSRSGLRDVHLAVARQATPLSHRGSAR